MPLPQPPSVVASRALLDELVRLGVRHVVLSPGSRSAPLAYAAQDLDRAGRLTLHVRVDERSAAYLALGLAKTTRVPAAVITTSGTAVANLHPAALEAHHGQVPLLLLTADRPPELRGVGANQATDQVGMLSHCRLVVDLETPARDRLPDQVRALRSTAARAVAAATGALGGAAGPVHVNLPQRDPLAPVPGGPWLPDDLAGRPDGAPWVALPADEGASPRLDAALPSGPGTLVVIGDLPSAEHRRRAFRWAAAHRLPVLAEPGAAPDVDVALLPHGTLALAATDWLDRHRPTHLVVVGRPTLGRSVPALTRHRQTEVHVVSEVAQWADATHEAVAVHPFAALDQPAEVAGDTAAWTQPWVELGHAVAEVVRTDAGAGEVTGADVARTLDQALPEGARLFLGSSSIARDHHLGVARPRADIDVVVSRGLAGIDGCVSTAAGLALAEPHRPTYAAVGDLTLLHDANGLLLGPDEPEPDLTVVVLDDRGGSIFTTLEYGAPDLAADFERVFATPTRTDVEALVRAHGWSATTARTREELAAALRPGPGLRVVVVPVDRGSRRTTGELLRSAVAALR